MNVVCGTLGRDAELKTLFTLWPTVQTNAVLLKYPTTASTLQLRLSEMFVHDRKLYFVANALQEAIVPLLDEVTNPLPNIVQNNNGILKGIRVEFTESNLKQLLKSVASS